MRITGGTFRSRALAAPRGQETRPTSDRVREALFSMVTSAGAFDEEEGPRVLDLYAGSGALGLEALSRGARSVTLVEHARAAVAAIRQNVRTLDVDDRVTLVARRVEQAISELAGPFDLVLVDPPYAEVRTRGFDALLTRAASLLTASGLLVLEHAATDEPEAPPGLVLGRRRRHGDTTLSLFHATGDEDARSDAPRAGAGGPGA